MNLQTLIAVMTSVALAASPALACKGRTVLYQDDFTKADAGWRPPGSMTISGGAMHIATAPRLVVTMMHVGARYDKIDMCAEMTFPQSGNVADIAGGLVFLGDVEDGLSFYALQITPQGVAYVVRLSNNVWSYPWGIPAAQFAEVRTGAGATNTLRLTLNRNRAHIYINDKKISEARAVPLEKGGYFGFVAQAGDGEPVSLSYSKLKVTDLPP